MFWRLDWCMSVEQVIVTKGHPLEVGERRGGVIGWLSRLGRGRVVARPWDVDELRNDLGLATRLLGMPLDEFEAGLGKKVLPELRRSSNEMK